MIVLAFFISVQWRRWISGCQDLPVSVLRKDVCRERHDFGTHASKPCLLGRRWSIEHSDVTSLPLSRRAASREEQQQSRVCLPTLRPCLQKAEPSSGACAHASRSSGATTGCRARFDRCLLNFEIPKRIVKCIFFRADDVIDCIFCSAEMKKKQMTKHVKYHCLYVPESLQCM